MDEGSIVLLVEELRRYGPAGLAVLAFISNLIPGFPALYLSLLASYAVLTGGLVDSMIAVVSVGVGAGFGKLALFMIAKYLGSRFELVRRRREALISLTTRRRSLLITVFLFAALPLPDDLLYIPLGVAGFNTLVFLVGVVTGKIVMALVVFLLGSSAKWVIDLSLPRLGELTLTNIAILVASTLIPAMIISYVVVSIDWLRVYKAYAESGEGEAAKVLVKEIADIVTLKSIRSRVNR